MLSKVSMVVYKSFIFYKFYASQNLAGLQYIWFAGLLIRHLAQNSKSLSTTTVCQHLNFVFKLQKLNYVLCLYFFSLSLRIVNIFQFKHWNKYATTDYYSVPFKKINNFIIDLLTHKLCILELGFWLCYDLCS